ncbi:TPA: restriction endonuclease subunit S [Vibrio vulnificus]
MVPNGWSLIKLKDIGKCINGLTYSPKNVVDNGLLVLRSSNVQGSKLAFDDNVYVNIDIASDSKTKVGDILLCVRNGSRNLIGKSAFIDESAEGLAHGAFMSLFRSNNTPNYTFQLFQSSRFFQQVNQNLGATINSINSGNLNQFKFPYPPLAERKKIAQILSTWDKAIATTEKLIDASKQQKKALMQQLLTGKKRLIDPETSKAFEGEWEEVKLGDVISLGRGFAFKSSQYADSGTKVVRVTNIASSGHIDLSDCVYVPNEITNEYQKYALRNEDILLVMVGATAGKLGFVSENILPSLLNQNMWSLRTRNLDKLNQLFLRHIAERIVARYVLTQQGSARGFFTQSTFELVNFQVPSVEEQQKIASVLTAADKEIELLNAKLAHLKQEKKALMQQLLTGKRRVRVAETEAA